MRSVKNLAWQLALALGLISPVWATDDLLTARLIDEAHHWQDKNRSDLAANAWRKVLLAVPDHAEALSQLRAMGEQPPIRRNTMPKLLAPGVTSSVTAATNIDTKVIPVFQGSLPQTIGVTDNRTAVAATQKPTQFVPEDVTGKSKTMRSEPRVAKQRSAAVPKIIAKLTPTRRAQTPHRLHTSQTSNDDWAQTRLKLEIAAEGHPSSLPDMIALTRHLGTHDATRHESLRQMADFARRGLVERNTQQSWRATLMALKPVPRNQPYFARYLAYYPDDVAVRQLARSLMMNNDENVVGKTSSTASKSTEQSAAGSTDALPSIQKTMPQPSATELRLSPSLLQQ